MISIKFKDTFRERLPEWVTSIALFLWGIIVLFQAPDLWNLEFFSVLARIAEQKTWGFIGVVVGGLRVIALAINGLWRPTGHIRALGALVGVIVWSAVLLSYLGMSWNPPATALLLAALALDFSALWFAAGDAKLADVRAKNGFKSATVL